MVPGVTYVESESPGIRRVKRGKAFSYRGPSGKAVRDASTLQRIRGLAIPPAWTNVWICRNPRGHLQATGRDARGRKQYRYHARWREARDLEKFERVISFAKALPAIRRRVKSHLRSKGLPRHKVLAAVVRLLETTLVRVGNDEYARTNDSYGLTTMRDKHASVNRGTICFDFRGKSGIDHEVETRDSQLATIVRACQDLPGDQLFQYLDDEGEVRDIGAADVNGYLQEISGGPFTAKDFRTWAGTVLAAQALKEFEEFDSAAAAKRNITSAIERVAERLGNTKAVCRKCYIHPAIFDAYLDRSLARTLKRRTERELSKSLARLPAAEAAVLAFLQRRISAQLRSTSTTAWQRSLKRRKAKPR
jgi:DNA topoisomerase-1